MAILTLLFVLFVGVLDLSGSNVTEAQLAEMSRMLTQLTSINLSSCPNIGKVCSLLFSVNQHSMSCLFVSLLSYLLSGLLSDPLFFSIGVEGVANLISRCPSLNKIIFVEPDEIVKSAAAHST